MTSFVPDIADVSEKYELLDYLLEFEKKIFSKKKKWKKTVNKHIYGKHNCMWQEKIEKNEQLYFYSKVRTKREIAEWWVLAKEYPNHLLEITNVVRLLCGSYKNRGKRISNPVVYTDVCDIRGKRFVLHCSASYDERENLWNRIVDSFAVEQTVYLVALSDLDFVLIILGQNRETLGLNNELRKSFLLKSAN